MISPLNFCRYLPAWVAALYLRDLDVPLSGGRSVREGEGQGGSVARRGADVDVDWKNGTFKCSYNGCLPPVLTVVAGVEAAEGRDGLVRVGLKRVIFFCKIDICSI